MASNPLNMPPLEPNLGNQFVTLSVGPKRKEIVVHKNLLCQSAEYFDKAFNSTFAEGQEGIMYLPEDKPGVVALFIDWMYRSVLREGHTKSYLTDLYHLWIFATKICLPKLADLAIDRIQDTCLKHNQFIDFDLVAEIYDNTATEAQLRTFALDLKLYELWAERDETEMYEGTFTCVLLDGQLELCWGLFQGRKELFKDFLSELQYLAQYETYDDPRKRGTDGRVGNCTYHCHSEDENEACGANRANGMG